MGPPDIPHWETTDPVSLPVWWSLKSLFVKLSEDLMEKKMGSFQDLALCHLSNGDYAVGISRRSCEHWSQQRTMTPKQFHIVTTDSLQ